MAWSIAATATSATAAKDRRRARKASKTAVCRVEVLYLHELLGEVLDVPEARDQLLDSALRPDLIGPALVPAAGRPHADEDETRRRCGHQPARGYLRRLATSCSAGSKGILGNPAARRTTQPAR